ncbi:FAD-dependent thymidylate synthase [Ferrimicrobium sp.]|uniref:FAD-dependent thymidylate synthase n=1 Tax=Ferrimicrobium sp. TaxID=2926050 RepID=UPI00263833A3|nr:FAD-dependent thymidylate synthase [Ferrimicrobium sp.]
MANYLPEVFSQAERDRLAPYFTNVDESVFCLQNVPQELAAALFARYSRSDKSLRRIFLDEFVEDLDPVYKRSSLGAGSRTRQLMGRVIGEYGDDSVAQLAVAHVAVEQVSTVLTRGLERHRLVSFLEQSTRYVNLSSVREDGSLRAIIPEELDGELRRRYHQIIAQEFDLYARVFDAMMVRFSDGVPATDTARLRAARAAALDTARGCLPMATMTNVGIVGSAQALEYLVIHLRSLGSIESRSTADLIAREITKVLGVVVGRMDRPDRGGRWTQYLAEKQANVSTLAASLSQPEPSQSPTPYWVPRVQLIGYDPQSDDELIPWMLYEQSGLSFAECERAAKELTGAERSEVFRAYSGERENRRHKPSRAWEMSSYTFEIETDYGSYRDLARHRLLTLLEQDPVALASYQVDAAIAEEGLLEVIDPVFDAAFRFATALRSTVVAPTARMVLPLAARVRFVVRLNARELLHLVELRSQPQGHPVYRLVAQEMYRSLERVGHRNLAAAMRFVDTETYVLGRRAQEERLIEKLEN